IFAVLTVNIGLEGWFSERVQQVVGSSLSAAQAYETEHRVDLEEDARALAQVLNATRENNPAMSDADLRKILAEVQPQIQRGLREAYVVDSTGTMRTRGER